MAPQASIKRALNPWDGIGALFAERSVSKWRDKTSNRVQAIVWLPYPYKYFFISSCFLIFFFSLFYYVYNYYFNYCIISILDNWALFFNLVSFPYELYYSIQTETDYVYNLSMFYNWHKWISFLREALLSLFFLILLLSLFYFIS